MKLLERLKIYIKHPSVIKLDWRDKQKKRKEEKFMSSREADAKYEDELLYDRCLSEFVGCGYDPNLKFGIFNPVYVVMREISLHFSRHILSLMKIMSIDVDTQNTEEVTVKIKLYRPGLLIGGKGKDIDFLTDRLTYLFGRKTVITIEEIRTNDINEPRDYGYGYY